jgi:hypothetical protein
MIRCKRWASRLRSGVGEVKVSGLRMKVPDSADRAALISSKTWWKYEGTRAVRKKAHRPPVTPAMAQKGQIELFTKDTATDARSRTSVSSNVLRTLEGRVKGSPAQFTR